MITASENEHEGGAVSRPFFSMHLTVPHYYGDIVRRIFLAAAAILLVTSPFLASASALALPLALSAALILAGLAALTSPRKRWVMAVDAVIAGAGVVVAEIFAIAAWGASAIVAFLISEALAIAFLFALYYGVKTVRAMVLGQIGRDPSSGEFLS